jgi:hypothetical protein
MKKCILFVWLLIVACSSDNSLERRKNDSVQEMYIHLIELLEKGSETQIPEELMKKIFSVYDEKLLHNSGPNALNPFMKCVKVHKDLLQIMKNAPTEVVQNFQYLQKDFLQELSMLKTCSVSDINYDSLTACCLLESAYLKFLLLHVTQYRDFYEECILKASLQNSFSPAIAMALYLIPIFTPKHPNPHWSAFWLGGNRYQKIVTKFGITTICRTSNRTLIEIPEVHVMSTKKPREKVLLLCSNVCCGTVILGTVLIDDDGNIGKIGFTGNCASSPMVEMKTSEFVILKAEDSFFRWNGHDKLLLKSDGKIESFWLDREDKRWARAWVGKEGASRFNASDSSASKI